MWPPWTVFLPEAPDATCLCVCGLGIKPGPWLHYPGRGEVSYGRRPGGDNNTEEEENDDEEEEHILHSYHGPGPLLTL